jgi:hypothetical protein
MAGPAGDPGRGWRASTALGMPQLAIWRFFALGLWGDDHASASHRRFNSLVCDGGERTPESAPSDESALRDILTGVPSQDFINQGLIPDAAPACFLAKLVEHSRIDSNGDQLARFIAKGRATDAPHHLQLIRR